MTVIKYILGCFVEFFDAWVGNGSDSSWLSFVVASLVIFATLTIYFLVYWRVVAPKCYKLWLCTVFSFLLCVLIWGAFALLCIGVELLIRGIF